MKTVRKAISFLLSAFLLLGLLAGCTPAPGEGVTVKLDPKKPVTVTVWHYYNGAVMNAFDQLVAEFNETVGVEKGIIVEGSGMGNVGDLQTAVLASARKEVGSQELPNIFASYADTAYTAEQLGILADIGQYFTRQELDDYIGSYIEEGRIGLGGELRIFPIAKSTEILMLNKTDWEPFAQARGYTYADLETIEGLVKVAAAFYEWTDARTPEIPNDGKAFCGRDSIANMIIIGTKQLGVELFQVQGGQGTVHADKAVMRRLWDNYYLPYVSGYFLSVGRYRSDDAKVGEIISYIGSTSSAMYFPSEVTLGGSSYPVEAEIMAPPVFVGGKPVLVQQGAGMAVTKGTPQQEYASAVFLKWFTDTQVNIQFSALSGYMPVKKEANDYKTFMDVVAANSIEQDAVATKTLEVAFEAVNRSEMYTSKAFDGGTDARSILENSMKSKSESDRAELLALLDNGLSHAEAIAQLDTEENFETWYQAFAAALEGAVTDK